MDSIEPNTDRGKFYHGKEVGAELLIPGGEDPPFRVATQIDAVIGREGAHALASMRWGVPCGKEYSHATSSDLCGDPDARSQRRLGAGNPDITITRVSTALDGGGRMAGASRTSATKIE